MDQLKAGVLAPEDLGPDFFIVDESGKSDPPQWARFFIRRGSDAPFGPVSETLAVWVVTDPSADPVTLADAYIDTRRREPDWEGATVSDRLAAEWLAPGAVAYQIAVDSAVGVAHGSVYVWRHGPVVAQLLVGLNIGVSRPAPGAATHYAELQRDKLVAVLKY